MHVAGAGVLGLSTAFVLASAGARVTVFDPAALGDNASGVAAGMIAPAFESLLDPAGDPARDLMFAARDAWPAFAEAAGIALDRRGALAAGDAARLDRVEAGLQALGAEVRRLTGQEASALAPGVCFDAAGAVLSRDDWRLDAGPALRMLARAAVAAGAAIVSRPAPAGDADWLVAATGAARGLAPELERLSPIKGHIIRAPSIAYAGCVVRAGGVYLTPGEGGLIAGATMEHGRDDRLVEPAQVEALRAAAEAAFPGLRGARVVGAAAVRAATADGLPLVGESVTAGVIVAAGARRNGWLLAPLVAQIVTAQVFGHDAGPFAARLSAGRLAPR